jgi:hypothetical protein
MKNKKLIKVMAVMTGTLLLFIQSLFAQNIGVTGTVKAENGEPIVGVSILVKGTSNGVVTDLDGKFTLRNVSSNATLVFSCIGFAHAEIPVNSRQQLDVVLKEVQLFLVELVVIGYGV